MTLRRLAAGLTVAVALVAGCGAHGTGSASRPGPNSDVTLSVRSVAGLGPIIVTHGWTLYMYPPDQQRHVTCTTADDCDTAWPPLLVGAGRKVIAGTGVQQRLIGTMAGDGGRVVTYNHWPLYYYIADRSPGALNGQGQGFNWYVMAPDGQPNKSHFASPTG